ncbi:anthranilate phosphoribosyltransferase [Robertmurraya korlensis]|uniref:anthranilate phosphoribosyltransferase n=1 Tax=Robertmurraya korlensis TaxID=519977 RepID=UPI0008267600|nr:anthranilate phosphoribosyltransferase [Robertmurraya korlensis]
MREYLQKLSEKKSLDQTEMKEAVSKLFSDEVTDSEIAAFLIGLKTKGETVEEIVGLVQAVRENSLTFTRKVENVMDNCGTGGDGSKSFNVSTTSAFVIAGAGIPVAKHGNRSISSKTGSADVLEHLGINLTLTPKEAEECLDNVGISFLFAPHVHPKIKNIMKVRRELKIPTIFNLIGPLTNPMELDYQLLGIYRRDLLQTFGEVLKTLGRKRAVVINGAGYMDEASLQGENHLFILDNGTISEKILTPEEVGLTSYPNESIIGGNAMRNGEILLSVLNGEKGACRDTVLLNAGIGIYASGKTDSIVEGIAKAKESIDSGAAKQKLEDLIAKGETFRKEGVV